MKKGFTLVELLIVVVVMITLMSMTFRLANLGDDSQKRNNTLDRMHRLENALSGYYAAFGTYPPVKLHGSRNPFLKVSDHGIQNGDGEENANIWGWLNASGDGVSNVSDEADAWNQVKAACLAQPVSCSFPWPEGYEEYVLALSEKMKQDVQDNPDNYSERDKRIYTAGFDDAASKNIGRFSKFKNKTDWNEVQIFRFGVFSYLLPRYLVMMNCPNNSIFNDYSQWTGNNQLPHDPLTGSSFSSWGSMRESYISSTRDSDLAHVANIASQAVCARWMANFESSLACNHNFHLYGVNVQDSTQSATSTTAAGEYSDGMLEVFSPGNYDDASTSNQYILDKVTMCDGWGSDLYYYSPAPYQSYRLWSSGPNKNTFPPWITPDQIDKDSVLSGARSTISEWMADDIVNLSR